MITVENNISIGNGPSLFSVQFGKFHLWKSLEVNMITVENNTNCHDFQFQCNSGNICMKKHTNCMKLEQKQ